MNKGIKEITSGEKVVWLTTFHKKLRGLLMRPPNSFLWILVPCKSIHTFGMRCALDVAFINEQGQVIKTYRSVQPRRRMYHTDAKVVFERFACDAPWFEEGEWVGISSVPSQKGEIKAKKQPINKTHNERREQHENMPDLPCTMF